MDEVAPVASQPPLAKAKRRGRGPARPKPLIPPIEAGMGDDPFDMSQAFGFLDTPHVRTPPPPVQEPERKEYVAPGYAPSRENDEAGTQDSLSWMGTP